MRAAIAKVRLNVAHGQTQRWLLTIMGYGDSLMLLLSFAVAKGLYAPEPCYGEPSPGPARPSLWRPFIMADRNPLNKGKLQDNKISIFKTAAVSVGSTLYISTTPFYRQRGDCTE